MSNVKEKPGKTEAEPKARAWYKGERVDPATLAKRLKGPIPVQFPGFRDGRLRSVLAISLRDGLSRGSKNMTYRDPASWGIGYAELDKDTEINILSGTQKTKIDAGWAEYQEKNLSRTIMNFGTTSGTDPEIFVVDADGEVIPAWTFLPSKAKAESLPGIGGQHNTVYWDGFQAEFTVSSAGCHQYLMDSVHSGLKHLWEAVQKKSKKAKFSIRSVVPVAGEILASADEKHVEFGCAPSMNLYGLAGKVEAGRTCPYRFAGGHIHLGIPPEYRPRIPDMVRAMDMISAVSCVSLFASFDSPVRRQYYGLPGEYRLPGHGLEYRTLSNAWLMHPVIAHLVFDLTRQCAFYGHAGITAWKATEDETLEIILNSDVEKARDVLTRNKGIWTQVLQSNLNYQRNSAERAFKAVMEGAESVIRDPEDIPGNWLLDGGWGGHSNAPNRWWNGAICALEKGKKV